jgi:ABC-type transporter MlaC component
MRLSRFALGATVVTMLVVSPNVGRRVLASEATDQVRTHIDQVYQLVARTESTVENREAVRKAADRMFNWAAMAEGALGQHWRERTPDERAEFVRVFTAVSSGSPMQSGSLTWATRSKAITPLSGPRSPRTMAR